MAIRDKGKELDDAQLKAAKKRFKELAKLSVIEYELRRKDAAKALNIREAILDQEVEKLRPIKESNGQGKGMDALFVEVEPLPGEVNGAALLDEVAETYDKHLVLPEHGANISALWDAHTYFASAFRHTPRLCYSAPEKGCGKTEALEVHQQLVDRPLKFENITMAAAFRIIAQYKPTLLLDEFDTYLTKKNGSDELRGILNAGYQEGGKVPRCEGDKNEVRWFPVFGAVALAGIGELPGTLHDRAITIHMTRAKRGEIREPLDPRRQHARFETLRRKLKRWQADNRLAISEAEPEMPSEAYNRVKNKWLPLFKVAHVAGGDWPEKVKKALKAAINTSDDPDSIGVMLLADIKRIWPAGADAMHSETIVTELHNLEGRPWPEYGRAQKPITSTTMSRLLGRFKIKSQQEKINSVNRNGYKKEQFFDAWARYLPPEEDSDPCQNSTTLQVNNDAGFSDFENSTEVSWVAFSNPRRANPGAGCRAVEFSEGKDGQTNKKRWEQPAFEVFEIPRATIGKLMRWLDSIGETDPAEIWATLRQCADDPDTLAYYLRRADEAPIPG